MDTISNNPYIFEMFSVEDKIDELKNQANGLNHNVLSGATIVIAVPSYDESGRFIYIDDQVLYNAQKQDANRLAAYIHSNTSSCIVDIILDADKSHTVLETNQPIDYVLFLHEFMDFERDYILDELRESKHGAMQAIELY